MGQAKRKKQLEAMGFDGQLQYRADDLMRAAQYLIDNRTAHVIPVPTEDGETWIGLVFKPSLWEMKDNRLIWKHSIGGQDEPKDGS